MSVTQLDICTMNSRAHSLPDRPGSLPLQLRTFLYPLQNPSTIHGTVQAGAP